MSSTPIPTASLCNSTHIHALHLIFERHFQHGIQMKLEAFCDTVISIHQKKHYLGRKRTLLPHSNGVSREAKKEVKGLPCVCRHACSLVFDPYGNRSHYPSPSEQDEAGTNGECIHAFKRLVKTKYNLISWCCIGTTQPLWQHHSSPHVVVARRHHSVLRLHQGDLVPYSTLYPSSTSCT